MNRIEKMGDEIAKKNAKEYEEMMIMLGLDKEYKKSSEICKILCIKDRTWRKYCEDVLQLYGYRLLNKVVIGNQKGYIYTDDEELIRKYIKAKEHQFKSTAYNYARLKNSFNKRFNIKIEEDIENQE